MTFRPYTVENQQLQLREYFAQCRAGNGDKVRWDYHDIIREYTLTSRAGKITLSIDVSILTLERARCEILNLQSWESMTENDVYSRVAKYAAQAIARICVSAFDCTARHAITRMCAGGACDGYWPGDTYTWLRIISDDIDHDALIFEVDGA